MSRLKNRCFYVKIAMLFLDLVTTRSIDIRVHRAGSQLKINTNYINMQYLGKRAQWGVVPLSMDLDVFNLLPTSKSHFGYFILEEIVRYFDSSAKMRRFRLPWTESNLLYNTSYHINETIK